MKNKLTTQIMKIWLTPRKNLQKAGLHRGLYALFTEATFIHDFGWRTIAIEDEGTENTHVIKAQITPIEGLITIKFLAKLYYLFEDAKFIDGFNWKILGTEEY